MITAKWCLGTDDIEIYRKCLEIRKEVFVREQGVPLDEELDGEDGDCVHLLVFEDEKPVATGRLRFTDDGVFLSRLAVLKEQRGKGFGDFAARLLIRKAFDGGWQTQRVHAQIAVRAFYERLGFAALGGEFLEAGIPHIEMSREGDI